MQRLAVLLLIFSASCLVADTASTVQAIGSGSGSGSGSGGGLDAGSGGSDASVDAASPSCGDGICNGNESCGSCPTDCGSCPPCGNGTCDSGETCASCPADCGACEPTCGDRTCNGDETCATCPGDCGACSPTCGDGTCNGIESCASCPEDCGPCPATCGDGTCSAGEDCTTCPIDCGACAPTCGDGTCGAGEDCTTCPADCGMCTPPCEGQPEDCYNVLQVFEDTAPDARPAPSCTDVANWIASALFDPAELSLGADHLESADLPWPGVMPSDIHVALYAGALVSFNRVAADGHTLCSFVSTWDSPMKSTWIVETPPLTPIDDTAVPDDPCDSGWQGQLDACEQEEAALLAAALLDAPPQDTSDRTAPTNHVVTTDPP